MFFKNVFSQFYIAKEILTYLFCNIFIRNNFPFPIFSLVGVIIFAPCVNLLQLRFCFHFILDSLRTLKSFFQLIIKFSVVTLFFLTILNLHRTLGYGCSKKKFSELSFILFSSQKGARSVSGWYSQYHDLTGVNF